MMSVMVPTFQITEGKEALVEQLDEIFRSYQKLEQRMKTENVKPQLDKAINSLYGLFLEHSPEVTVYILEASKMLSPFSAFMRDSIKVLETASSKHQNADAYYCLGELHRCKILQEDVFLSHSTPLFRKAAELGHRKGMQRYEENEKAVQAYHYMHKPYSSQSSALYYQQAMQMYHQLVKAGRYEFAVYMLNEFERTKDEVNIHKLLKYLTTKMPNNPKLAFMYKEHKKDMVLYYFKKYFKLALLVAYMYVAANWIITKLHFTFQMPFYIILCNLFVYIAPAVYVYRNTRQVFWLLLALFEPSQQKQDNWDCLMDCMLISMLF